MQRKYIWILLFIFLGGGLFFFWNKNHQTTPPVSPWTGKTDFYIELKDFSDFSTGTYLEKSWKITSTEEIKMNSQAIGRVSVINVKEGDKVRAGQVLMSLQDNVASYGINLDRAKNGLQRAQISYDSTKINLEKQVFESEIALEKLQNSLDTLKKNTALDVKQVQDNLTDTDYSHLDSQWALQLQKIDNSILKAELDFQNQITTNGETIDWFKTNLKNSYNALQIFLDDIILFWDKLLWVTDEYKNDVAKYNDYLWGKDKPQRQQTEEALRKLIAFRDIAFVWVDLSNLDDAKILSIINTLSNGYELSKWYLNDFEKTFTNSIPSLGILSDAEITAYNTTINAYQWQLQWNNAQFLTFSNGAISFLKTYKNTQASTQKQIDLMKQDREITRKNLENTSSKTQIGLDKTLTNSSDSERSLNLQLRSAQDTFDNAKKMRDITLQSLQNAIKEAQISYESALKEYSKLTISAPIDGVVWDIIIDKWQDVSTWTPLVTLLGSKKSEIEIMLKTDELSLVAVWDKVTFDFNGKPTQGTIYSITKVTDNNFNYKANVIFDTQFDIIWWVVKVKLPIKVKFPLLPLNIVTVVWNDIWYISTYRDWKIEQKEVILWKLYGDSVEFIRFKDEKEVITDMKVVMTDVTNFDESKSTLKVTN